MFFNRLRAFVALLVAVTVSLLFGFATRALRVSKFADISGERVFYLYSASSQAKCVSTLSFLDIFCVKGESVAFDVETDGETLAREIALRYGAEIILREEAGDVVSYYAYTPAWGERVCVGGKAVNLHIAVRENACAVGTPIIFGGF